MKTNDTISRLRMLGYFEALSWVFLLFIAMPLKYFGGKPLMVTYVGWVHGILFILYSLHLVLAMRLQSWSFGKLVTGGIAAFLPFGTLWFDKRIN
jgi:integral membrane protein